MVQMKKNAGAVSLQTQHVTHGSSSSTSNLNTKDSEAFGTEYLEGLLGQRLEFLRQLLLCLFLGLTVLDRAEKVTLRSPNLHVWNEIGNGRNLETLNRSTRYRK